MAVKVKHDGKISAAAREAAAFVGVPRERLDRACDGGERIDAVNLSKSGARRHRTVRITSGEIARLVRAGKLERHLVEAATRLEALYEACGFSTPQAVDPARIRVDGSAAAEPTVRMMDARDAYSAAMAAIGPLARAVVIAVVIEGVRLSEVARRQELHRNRRDRSLAALWVLKTGLDALAQHFGLRGNIALQHFQA